MASKLSVQVTLRIDPAEYEQFKAAAAHADLSVPMWLINCGRIIVRAHEASQ